MAVSLEHYEKYDPDFANDLRISKRSVLIASEWWNKRNYEIRIPPMILRPDVSQMAQFSDDGDMYRRTPVIARVVDTVENNLVIGQAAYWRDVKFPKYWIVTVDVNSNKIYLCDQTTRQYWSEVANGNKIDMVVPIQHALKYSVKDELMKDMIDKSDKDATLMIYQWLLSKQGDVSPILRLPSNVPAIDAPHFYIESQSEQENIGIRIPVFSQMLPCDYNMEQSGSCQIAIFGEIEKEQSVIFALLSRDISTLFVVKKDTKDLSIRTEGENSFIEIELSETDKHQVAEDVYMDILTPLRNKSGKRLCDAYASKLAKLWMGCEGHNFVESPDIPMEDPDAIQLYVEERVEVKHRQQHFTSVQSFRFDWIFVDVQHAFDKANPRPKGYMMLNQSETGMMLISTSTYNEWLKPDEPTEDRKKGDRPRNFYSAHKKHFTYYPVSHSI